MKSIFLVGAVQAFFLTVLLISKKKKITADYILAVWLTVTGIPLLLYFINYASYSLILNHSGNTPSYLMIINIPLLLIQSPFLYIYVSYAVKNTKSFNSVYLLHFIPAVVFIILFYRLVDFNAENKTAFNIYEYPHFQIILLFFPLTLILAFFYIIKSFLRIKKYKKKLQTQFSYTENIDFKWLKNLMVIISAVWLILSLFAVLFKSVHFQIQIHNIVLISISVAIFVTGYFGFLKTDIFYAKEQVDIKKNTEKTNSEKQPVSEEKARNLIESLIKYTEKEKPYLESKLTIKELADKISVQPHHLSFVLNEQLNKNFFDFINEYRVEEVKKQLLTNTNYTLLGIAYECGFNSKSSFNRIFKNFTGLTPSEFQKKHKS